MWTFDTQKWISSSEKKGWADERGTKMQTGHEERVCREHWQSCQHGERWIYTHWHKKFTELIVNPKLKGNLPVKSCQNWHAQHSTPYKAKPSSCTSNEWLEERCCRGSFCHVGQMVLFSCGRQCGNWQRCPTVSVKFTFPSPLRAPFAFHHCHGHAPKQVLFLSCTLRENSRVSCIAGPHSRNLRSHSLPKIKPFSLSAALTW